MAQAARHDTYRLGGPWRVWGGFALALALAPWLLSSHLAVTLLSQIGIAIIACLSYNLLLGQGGMLSFGHAVYTGAGAYLAMYALRAVGAGDLPLPVSLVPLVGGLAGLALAVPLGYLSTRRAGTPLAMVTLGLGELVSAVALMFPTVFGGEAGISGDRVAGAPVLGISFGPAVQLYALIAVYTFVCTALLYALTLTSLGRILNAVRDNPERVEFIGYNPQRVRHLVFIVSGFFAGVAGGLACLLFEIVTPEVLGTARSGAYLLFTFLGGTAYFVGPIIGAVLMVLSTVLLSALTQAWLLYLGLAFVLMVMYAPGGIASVVARHGQVAASGRLRRLVPDYLALAGAGGVTLAGAGALIEMAYHRQLHAALGGALQFWGLPLDVDRAASWGGAVIVLCIGLGLFALARRRWRRTWDAVQAEATPLVRHGEAT